MDWLGIILTFIGAFIVLRALASITIHFFGEGARKREEFVTERVLRAVDLPVTIIILLVAVYITMRFYNLPLNIFGYVVSRDIVFSILTIVIGAFGVNRVVGYVMDAYEARVEKKVEFRFMQRSLSIVVWLCAALMILALFRIDIGPLVAGMGVIGIALALALQDPLKNFFAALSILGERQFKPGDFIIIDGDQRKTGTVIEISWRRVKMATITGTILTIPNAKLAESIIEVASQVVARPKTTVKVMVSYDAPLTKVETILHGTVKEFVGKGIDKSFKPLIDISDFPPGGVEYSIRFLHQAGHDPAVVAGEIRKEIIKEFRKEKIKIPSPTYSINVQGM
jgi:MscS family membrane protein